MKPFWRNLLGVTACVIALNIVTPLALALLRASSMPPEHIVFSGYAIGMVAAAIAYLLVLKIVPLKPRPIIG